MSERRRAVATACVRVETPSFAIAAPSCVRAVSGEMKSSRPIDSFEWPSASSRSTSRSRGGQAELPGRGCADDDVGERRIDVHPAVRRPSRARGRARRAGASLSTNPRAPASSASSGARVTETRVDDACALRRRPATWRTTAAPRESGHPHVEDRERRTLRLDQRDRLLAVPGAADDPIALRARDSARCSRAPGDGRRRRRTWALAAVELTSRSSAGRRRS